jgi:hypothetical protein
LEIDKTINIVKLSLSQTKNLSRKKLQTKFNFVNIANMAKIMIGIKVSEELKKLLQEQASEENRTMSNFIKHCVLTYLKEKKDIDFKE